MSGKELSQHVRSLYPHIRILLMSGHPQNSGVDPGGLNAGMPLLQKPFTPSGLAHKLREVLDKLELSVNSARERT
jgi:two-component SAPR family response regulator